MDHYGIVSIIPPLLALSLAFWTRQVHVSLIAGIFSAFLILSKYNLSESIIGLVNSPIEIFKDAGNTKVILFSILVGSFIHLLKRSGSIKFFENYCTSRNFIRSDKSASFFSFFVGIFIFIESSITCLIAGTVGAPFFERFKISKNKLAYIIDATSAYGILKAYHSPDKEKEK